MASNHGGGDRSRRRSQTGSAADAAYDDAHLHQHQRQYQPQHHEHDLQGLHPLPLQANAPEPRPGAAAASSLSSPLTTADPRYDSKWKVVRPWKPPSNDDTLNLENGLKEGNISDTATEDDDDEEGDDVDEGEEEQEEDDNEHIHDLEGQQHDGTPRSLNGHSHLQVDKRLQLEVVDVSTTSVSLALFESPRQSPSATDEHAALDQRFLPSSDSASSPNISIKLNSAPWPHVLHSDAALSEVDGPALTRDSLDDPAPPAGSSILVWGLSPGIDYHIELGVFADEPDDEDVDDMDDRSDTADTDEDNVQVSTTVRTLDAQPEPDVPPPPYSSHDPSVPSTDQGDAEVALRIMLDTLRNTSRQNESNLHSSIAALRRTNDKLIREDQRQRQRIYMLEDSTARLQEVALEENVERETLDDDIAGLEGMESDMNRRIESRKERIERLERLGKEESERDDIELSELRERLDTVTTREDGVLAQKLKLERELLPTYNIQLATLEADVRRMLDDQRRNYMSTATIGQHGLYGHSYSSHQAVAAVPGVSRSTSLRYNVSNRGPGGSSSSSSSPAVATPTSQQQSATEDGSTAYTRTPPHSTVHPSPPASVVGAPHATTKAFEASVAQGPDGEIGCRAASQLHVPPGTRARSASLGKAGDEPQSKVDVKSGGLFDGGRRVDAIKERSAGAFQDTGNRPRPGSPSSPLSGPEHEGSVGRAGSTRSSRFSWGSNSWASKVVGGGAGGAGGSVGQSRKASGSSDH